MTDSRGSTAPTTKPELTVQSGQPGPIYDRAMRSLVQSDPPTVCRLLGLPELSVQVQPSVLSNTSLTADLILRLGPQRLANIEYVTTVRPGLVTQLLGYRFAIMRDYPDHELTQHVIVLGDGTVRGHDELTRWHFVLELHVLYLRHLEAAAFLKDPRTAPLAVLARGSTAERAHALEAALRVIDESNVDHSGLLYNAAGALAAIRLDTDMIGKIVREATMSAKTAEEIFQMFRDVGWADPFIRQGRQEGLRQGRQQILARLIEKRFGPHAHTESLAERLSAWPESYAFDLVTESPTFEDLLNARLD
jgi:hypothetical protein